MFKYTLDNKRYHTLNYFYKTKFGTKVFKVSLMVALVVLISMGKLVLADVYIVLSLEVENLVEIKISL